MSRIDRIIVLSLGMALVSAAGMAAEPLSVGDAVRKALEHSPSLQASREGETVAREKIGEARSMRGVRVTAGISDTRLNSPMMAFGARLDQGRIAMSDFQPDRLNDPDAVNNLKIGAQVVLPVYLGGMDAHAVSAARSGKTAAGHDTAHASEEVIFQAIDAYLGVLLARESVSVAEKACDASLESLRNAEAAVAAQRAVASDLLQARVHHSQNEETLLRMKNQHALALEALATVMGVASATDFDLTMPLLNQECTSCGDAPAHLLETALRQRPDYLALLERVNALERSAKMHDGAVRPHVAIGAAAEQNRDGFGGDSHGNNMVFARVDWNIADGGEAKHKAAGARAQANQMRRMAEALKDGIHLQIREAITGLNNALERIRVSREAIDHSDESLRILRDRYAAGLAIMSDVLGAETGLLSHRMNHVKALYDYSISRARLKMALGELTLERCVLLHDQALTPVATGSSGM
ncbi:MAG TPA: TolC family protein [Candidatus Ozemobacteraceae bacterium]|nr:TolC family protein [Candidatus Ozemobacteraceae bacterium]